MLKRDFFPVKMLIKTCLNARLIKPALEFQDKGHIMDMKNICVMDLCDRRHDKHLVTASYRNQMKRFYVWIMGNLDLWQARLFFS